MSEQSSVDPQKPRKLLVKTGGNSGSQRRKIGWRDKIAGLRGGALFGAYETEWQQNHAPRLRWQDVDRMLHNGPGSQNHYVARSLADWVKRSGRVRHSLDTLRPTIKAMVRSNDADLWLPLWLALESPAELHDLYRELVADLEAQARAYRVSLLIKELTALRGREQVRQEIAVLLLREQLLEEEMEALVEVSVEQHLFDWQTLPSLSPSAPTIALKLLQRGEISHRELGPFFAQPPPKSSGQRDGPLIEEKARSLAQRVSIPMRLTGSGLDRVELARLQTTWLHPVFTAIASGLFRRAFRHPMLEEFFHFWAHEWPLPLALSFSPSGANGNFATLGVPLVRLLHMRLILDAPSLAASVTEPQEAFAPEVMLYLLRNDGVTYTPALHLLPNSERGWRRRWAEATGEALSCLFLMDALPLELTTLRRIRESSMESTPDFQAMTLAGEPIVFEAKGATTWSYFRESKRKALRQLNKMGPLAAWQRDLGRNANARGRAFACGLFVTSGEEAEPSQFHVEDPPFGFDRFFHEAWERDARRQHYSAVLQAAGLFQEALAVADGKSFEPDSNVNERALRLPDGKVANLVGTHRYLHDVAGPLGIRDQDSFRACRIFTGLEREIYRRLSRGDLPPAKSFGSLITEKDRSDDASDIPHFGLMPSDGPSEIPGGVFSRMANGSCLCVEYHSQT